MPFSKKMQEFISIEKSKFVFEIGELIVDNGFYPLFLPSDPFMLYKRILSPSYSSINLTEMNGAKLLNPAQK